MLDMSMFRDHADVIRADHDRRGLSHDSIDEVIRLDDEWRRSRYDADQLRKQRNEAARGIAEAKKSGDESAANEILERVTDIGAKIDELSLYSDECLSKRDSLRLGISNILHDDVQWVKTTRRTRCSAFMVRSQR